MVDQAMEKPNYLNELKKPENHQRLINGLLLVYEQAVVTKVDQFIHVYPAEGFGGPVLTIIAQWPDNVDVVPGDQ